MVLWWKMLYNYILHEVDLMSDVFTLVYVRIILGFLRIHMVLLRIKLYICSVFYVCWRHCSVCTPYVGLFCRFVLFFCKWHYTYEVYFISVNAPLVCVCITLGSVVDFFFVDLYGFLPDDVI